MQLLSSDNTELSDGAGGAEKDGRESSYVRYSLICQKSLTTTTCGSSAVSDAQELDWQVPH